MTITWSRTLLLAAALSFTALAAERATITGLILDPSGRPIDRASVIVYAAGVKVGYSTYCPTCYTDCGKRVLTDTAGAFRIQSLDPSLWFRLLVVREGYEPMFVMKVDPAAGPVQETALKPRPVVTDPGRVLRGRVVTAGGVPVRDALVRPEMVSNRNVEGHYRYDQPLTDADRMAVTNSAGEFEIVYARPAAAMVLMVEARGMAPKRFRDVFLGPETNTLTVTDGAIVRGHVSLNGKPVGGVEVGLSHRNQWQGHDLDDITIGTQPDGYFVIPNVPANEEWYAFVKPQSLAGRGAAQPVKVVTPKDGAEVDAGELSVVPGLHLRGKIELTDGSPIPAGMEVRITSACTYCWEELEFREPAGFNSYSRTFHVGDTQSLPLPPDGRFEFTGLAAGPHEVSVAVKGYTLAQDFPALRAPDLKKEEEPLWSRQSAEASRRFRMYNFFETMVTTNVDNFVIKLDPAPK